MNHLADCLVISTFGPQHMWGRTSSALGAQTSLPISPVSVYTWRAVAVSRGSIDRKLTGTAVRLTQTIFSLANRSAGMRKTLVISATLPARHLGMALTIDATCVKKVSPYYVG